MKKAIGYKELERNRPVDYYLATLYGGSLKGVGYRRFVAKCRAVHDTKARNQRHSLLIYQANYLVPRDRFINSPAKLDSLIAKLKAIRDDRRYQAFTCHDGGDTGHIRRIRQTTALYNRLLDLREQVSSIDILVYGLDLW